MSRERSGPLVSQSQIYTDVTERKGLSWSDYKSTEIEWSTPDNYFIVAKVGRGKYSTVFKAIDHRKREAALKVLVPLDPKRYLREIKILQNLADQKNIVKLYDLIRDPATGIYSFVFEWVEFNDWRSLYSSFSIEDVRYYMYQLLIALDTSHKNGIMHRDVKPQNIAIDKEEKKLRLLDWGLADFYVPRQKYNSHVATRVFKPPEVLLNYPYYDYSMDIWSAGLTFAIMLFRRMVIEGADTDNLQLVKVAELVGGRKILEYAKELRVKCDSETAAALAETPGTGWKAVIAKVDPSSCPQDAVDLLNRMMVVDHRERISARMAMKHPFFDSLKNKKR